MRALASALVWLWSSACGPSAPFSADAGGAGSDAVSPGQSEDDDDRVCVGGDAECGPCSAFSLGQSYIGCEYFATITGNLLFATDVHQFAVAIANTSDTAASVSIEGGALAAPLALTVAPGDVAVQELPWHDRLVRFTSHSQRVAGGAYRIASDRPVTVYQFSPLHYQVAGTFSYTNDASLLYPTNALGTDHWVVSWPSWTWSGNLSPSLLAITGTADATTVTVTPSTDIAAGDVPAMTAGQPATLTLARGEVIQLFATGGDVTGTRVVADQPIQVIGGHYCTNLPHEVVACDHLEEQMMPADALGTRYAVTTPALTRLPSPKARTVRIVATEPGTTLSYDPPQPGAPTTIATAGNYATIDLAPGSFVIEADKKIVVAEYMLGRAAGADDEGDPSLSIAVPVDQYRRDYLFHAPLSYDVNFVNVVAPLGAAITLDGTPVTGFAAIGNSGYAVARAMLSAAGNGNHSISGDHPFGISVYGYGFATSYWYPGGLDLRPIVVE